MTVGPAEVVAAIGMLIALCVVPFIVARRVKHGEARFDKDGRVIEDE